MPVEKGPRAGAAASSSGMLATASNMASMRRVGPSNAQVYRNWAIHGELVRAALDIKIGQLVDAEWELVPFDTNGKTPDRGLMNRMYEILAQPNPGEESIGTFLQAVGEDLWTIDAAPFEKERTLRGDLLWMWPVDGSSIKVDRLWGGNPNEPRYYFVPQPDVAVPLLNADLGYMKMHNRSYSPLGIPPLETLKNTITAELNGSMYNDRQVTQAAPDGIMDLGENARPDQVESFKALWNSLIAGKSMMAFWGGTKSAKFIPFKNANREMQFIEWQEYLVRKLCAVMYLSPQDLGFSFDINKSTGEVQQSQTDDKGAFGLKRVQDVMTTQFCWDQSFGGRANNIAFRYRAVSVRVRKQTAETHKITLAGMPEQTINEGRRDMGLPPIGDPRDPENPFNQLMANTSQGLVRLDDIPTARELAERSTTPPDPSGGGEPKKEPPKQIEERGLVELTKGITDLSTAVASRPVSVVIEKGAVAVENHEAERPVNVSLDVGRIDDVVDEIRSVAGEVRDVAKSISELPAPVVNVEPVVLEPTVIPAPEVLLEPTSVDLTPVVDAVKSLEQAISKPREEGPIVRREVKRDANGRIIEVIDHREA